MVVGFEVCKCVRGGGGGRGICFVLFLCVCVCGGGVLSYSFCYWTMNNSALNPCIVSSVDCLNEWTPLKLSSILKLFLGSPY